MSSLTILSAVGGAAFGGANFWLLSRIVRALVDSENVKKWKTGLYFVLKMALILSTFGLILKKGYVSPLPFLAGFSASLVMGIAMRLLLHRDS